MTRHTCRRVTPPQPWTATGRHDRAATPLFRSTPHLVNERATHEE